MELILKIKKNSEIKWKKQKKLKIFTKYNFKKLNFNTEQKERTINKTFIKKTIKNKILNKKINF